MNIPPRLLKSGYVRNVGKLVSSTVVSQVITLAAMVVMTRIYSASQFGLLAFSMSVSTVLSVLASGRYEFAVMNPSESRDAGILIGAAAALSLLFGAILGLLVVVGSGMLARTDPKFAALAWGIVVLTVAQAWFSVAQKWANRSGHYDSIAKSTVVVALVSNVGPLLVPALGWKPSESHLIFFYGASQFAGILVTLRSTGAPLAAALRGVTVREMAGALNRFWKFPVFTLPHSLASKLTPEIPTLFLTAFFSPASAGVFSIARRALNQPMYLLANNVGNVFHRRLGGDNSPAALRREINLIVAVMGAVMLPVSAVLLLWGKVLFATVFGSQFADAGLIAQILLPALVLRMMAAPVAYVFMVFEEQWRMLALQLLHISLVSAAFWIGQAADNVWLAFWLYSGSSAVVYLATILLARKVASEGATRNRSSGNAEAV